MMRAIPCSLPIVAFVLSSCVTKLPDEEPIPYRSISEAADEPEVQDETDERADAESAESMARKVQAIERQMRVAGAKLEVARLESDAYKAELGARFSQAKAELELARKKLVRFEEAELPNRLASERLDLQNARDRAQEAADELAQIEIMYDEQDLDDMTAEFVVSRGRRNAERAAARIVIQEAALRILEEHELPQEAERLALDVAKAEAACAQAEREGEIGRRGKAIAVQEAEHRIADFEAELATLREKSAGSEQ